MKPFGSDGPDLRLEASEPGSADPPAIIGDTLEADSAEFTARVLNLDEARAARPGVWALRVVRDGLPFVAVPIPPSGDEFEFAFPSLGQARYRLQVERLITGGAAIEALSSPIYLGPDDVGPPPPPPPPPADCATPLKGTSGADTFAGTDAGDDIRGGGGRDRISGADGDDCLRGGRGADRLREEPGGHDRRQPRRRRIKAADGEVDVVRCGRSRHEPGRGRRAWRGRGGSGRSGRGPLAVGGLDPVGAAVAGDRVLAGAPRSRSAPRPPRRQSSPSPPEIRSRPPPPRMSSPASVPVNESAPLVPLSGVAQSAGGGGGGGGGPTSSGPR